MSPEPLRVESLNAESRALLTHLDAIGLGGRGTAGMVLAQDGTWDLAIAIPSPSGDARRAAAVWLDEKHVPSIEFGTWHSHADLWEGEGPSGAVSSMLAYLARILRDEIVLIARDGQALKGFDSVIEAGDRDALLEELTRPGAPETVTLLTWSGTGDPSWVAGTSSSRCPMARRSPSPPVDGRA
jgi:hypothetical protein